MAPLRRTVSWLWAAALLALATPAWACPYCVGQDRGGMASSLVIAAMVSVPFLIVAVTGVLIRRANREVAIEAPDNSEVC